MAFEAAVDQTATLKKLLYVTVLVPIAHHSVRSLLVWLVTSRCLCVSLERKCECKWRMRESEGESEL